MAEVIEAAAVTEEQRHRRILVAVDGGEESTYALSWCIKHVLSPESTDVLILLHAVPHGFQFSKDVAESMDNYHKELSDAVIEKATELCSDLPNVKMEKRVEKGDPRDVICHMVEELKVDMLVMGTHGHGLIRRAFLGSVSSHCAQHVKCPVLVVKKPKPKH